MTTTENLRILGSTTVTALLDGEGPFFAERDDVFPTATEEQWQAADEFDPGAVDNGHWHLHFRCYAIRSPRMGTVLVDTGIGPVTARATSWAPVPGVLPESLASAGIDRTDVATVVLTHLHTDHTGWAVVGDHDGMKPYFPNARYVVQSSEVRSLRMVNPLLEETLVAPLTEFDQLSVIHGEESLSNEVRIILTPGHTPGHQSVLVESENGVLVVTGDVLVHAIQLLSPGVGYGFESDPDKALTSREMILRLGTESEGELGTAHLSEPFSKVPNAT